MRYKKEYDYLKLKEDFFNNKEIKKLKGVAGGSAYVLIYLKLMLSSLENNGVLYFDGVGKDFAEELSFVIDENVEDIGMTLLFLEKQQLLQFSDEGDWFELIQVGELNGR